MAELLRKARRSAVLRQARRDLERARRETVELEQTPPPVAVALGGEPAPSSQPSPPVSTSRPRGRRRLVVGLAAALLALGAFAATRAPRLTTGAPAPDLARDADPLPSVLAAVPELPLPDEVVPTLPVAPAPRADAHLNREGYGHIPGGVVFVPSTFSSADGSYDLYVHFHGNTRVVLESAEYAKLDAIVAVVNLGVNSAPYTDAYETPGAYERTLGAVGRALGDRGLANAHLHRVAIGSWSGGYGAVSRILEHDSIESLDAVLVLDGIHCGYLEENPRALNTLIISPFLRGAKRAAEGKLFFSITHSEIDPGAYAGTSVTAAYLLDAVHGTRGEAPPPPEHIHLRAAEGAVSRKLEKRMDPLYEATVGSFHVRGYRGNTPEHHMAHLLQMGATVMPELAERWRAR